MSKYFAISGYFKDDKNDEFDNFIVKDSHDIIEGEDDDVFFYGMCEEDIVTAIRLGIDTAQDFVIRDYQRVDWPSEEVTITGAGRPWNFALAGVYSEPDGGGHKLASMSFSKSVSQLEKVANGRLMAAAPELLRYARILLEEYTNYSDNELARGAGGEVKVSDIKSLIDSMCTKEDEEEYSV